MSISRPNRALPLARQRAKMSRYELAGRIAEASRGKITREAADRALSRIESGRTQKPSEIYQQLICQVLRESPTALFGSQEIGASELNSTGSFTVTCRKYIPIVLPNGAANSIAQTPEMEAVEFEGITAHTMGLEWPHDEDSAVHLVVLPFGVLVAELRQTVEFHSLAELAVWRHTSYETDRPHVEALIRTRWPVLTTASADYVLGTWWLARSCWSGQDLEAAVRIMSTPSVLLNRQGNPSREELLAGAEIAERSLMAADFEADGLVDFGAVGVSIGYATWSGVAYAPLAVDRALHPDELGDLEVICQGLWALCDAVCGAVEAGQTPEIEEGYDWRWLRGITTRITRPRPTETRQIRVMREAVVQTSALATMLPETIAILRDTNSVGTR